jgi:hypothetical protein
VSIKSRQEDEGRAPFPDGQNVTSITNAIVYKALINRIDMSGALQTFLSALSAIDVHS